MYGGDGDTNIYHCWTTVTTVHIIYSTAILQNVNKWNHFPTFTYPMWHVHLQTVPRRLVATATTGHRGVLGLSPDGEGSFFFSVNLRAVAT